MHYTPQFHNGLALKSWRTTNWWDSIGRALSSRRSIFMLMLSLALATGAWDSPCFAQTAGVAQIAGIIRDPSGSAVAGAQVKITQVETKQERQITSDDQGRYLAPALPVGPYQLEVTATGFKAYLRSSIVLEVGNNVAINVVLQIGATSERVDVTAQTNMVDTSSNAISQVIDERRIVELPLNGRQPTQLILLAGGAVSPPGSPGGSNNGSMTGTKSFYSSVTISVAGGQANGVNYLLDGGDNNDAFSNVNLPIPFPDALQEFSVQTSSLPARFGLHPAGVVNAVTKSGTNDWHGDLFEFLRNGDVNARNFFAPVHDSLKRNQYGGTFGDRIIRDKLFIFGGYQATRNRSNPPQSITFVPTPDVLRGDFSIIDGPGCVAGGKTITLINPATGTPFQGNQIPVSSFSPVSLALLKTLPAAQNACGKLTFGVPTTGDEDQGIVRMDWLQSSKHTIYGRYFIADYRNPAVSGSLLDTTSPGLHDRAQSATLGDTYTISPTVLNSAHFTFTRRIAAESNVSDAPNMDTKALGINDDTVGPDFFLSTINGYFSVGCSTCKPSFFTVNSFSFAEDVDIVRGKHQIAFGVNFNRNQYNSRLAQTGTFAFNGQYNTGLSVGDGLAAFMLGIPNSYQQQGLTQNYTRQAVWGMYIQDSIRLTPRLTINAGLRWDPALVPYDLQNQGSTFSQANFNAGIRSSVYTNAPPGLLFYGDKGVPKGFQNSALKLFSPRLGIAWDPTGTGRQSLRVSGAILRDTETLYENNMLAVGAPFGTLINRGFIYPTGGTFSNPWTGYPGGSPFPLPVPPPSNYALPTAGSYIFFPLKMTPTYMAQWSVSYQLQISSWLLTASYLGNKTTHVQSATNSNPAVYIPGSSASTNNRRVLYLENPTYGSYYSQITTSDPNGNSHYNGLLVSMQHRFSHGFTWLTNYTWSHCLTDVDMFRAAVGNSGEYEQPNNRSADYGNCFYDTRHVMNTSLVAVSPVKGHGLAGRILGQWQLAPLVSMRSGLPLNIVDGADISQTGSGTLLDRPNLVLGVNPYLPNGNPTQYLNPAAFQVQAAGTFGDLGKDVLHAPGAIQFDVALTRTFRIRERWQLTPRFEAFNVINHTNFAAPNITLNTATFGQITAAADPRILQFAMKLQF